MNDDKVMAGIRQAELTARDSRGCGGIAVRLGNPVLSDMSYAGRPIKDKL